MTTNDDANLTAPDEVLSVWHYFEAFPMETLTKAWVYKTHGPRQRGVQEMDEHRARYGASGNCFDLAFWLEQRFNDAGVESWFVSDDITSEGAHVAVIAKDSEGRRYLCDLGDLWLQPLAIDSEVRVPLRGYYPGADDTTRLGGGALLVDYHRFGGKRSNQRYDLSPIPSEVFGAAAETNQARLAKVLVEMRDAPNLAHWEYEDSVTRWSKHTGLFEKAIEGTRAASTAIADQTGMNADYVADCLEAFSELRK